MPAMSWKPPTTHTKCDCNKTITNWPANPGGSVFTGMKLRKALEPKTVKIKPRSMREIRVSIFMRNIDDG